MIRTAISPRLATRTRRNGGVGGVTGAARLCAKTRAPARPQSGMLPCFFRGFVSRLSASIVERADEPRPRLGRPDDVVDIAARRGDVRVRELRLVLRDESRPFRVRVGRRGELLAIDDVDRALRAHHRDLGRRPREVHVAADVLAAHDVVGAAVRLAGDDRQLRDGRLGVGVQQLRAVPDDPAVFLADTGQEPRHVDERDQRDVEASQVRTNRAALTDASMSSAPARTAGCCATIPTLRPPSRANPTMMFCAQPGWISRNVAVVDDATQDVVHVVRHPRIVGDDRVERDVHPVGRIGRVATIDGRREIVLRQVRQQRPRRVERSRLVRRREMRDAAARRVRRRAAEELRVDILVGHGLHDVRAR